MMSTANLQSSVSSLHSLTHRSSPSSFGDRSPSTSPSSTDVPLTTSNIDKLDKSDSSPSTFGSTSNSGPASLSAILSHSPSPTHQQPLSQPQAKGSKTDGHSGKGAGEKTSQGTQNQAQAPRNTLGYQFTSLFPPPPAITRIRTTTSANDPFDFNFDSPSPVLPVNSGNNNHSKNSQSDHTQHNTYSLSSVSSFTGRRKSAANLNLSTNGKSGLTLLSPWSSGYSVGSLSASTTAGPTSLQGYLNPISLQNNQYSSTQPNGMASLTQGYPMDGSIGQQGHTLHHSHSNRSLSRPRGANGTMPPITSINGHGEDEDDGPIGTGGVSLDTEFDLDLDNYEEEDDDLNQIEEDDDAVAGMSTGSILLRDFQTGRRRDYTMGTGIGGAGTIGSSGMGIPIGMGGDNATLASVGLTNGSSTTIGLASFLGKSGSKEKDKQVRRRSSKACDQCRKSKCKCERNSDNEPCKSCVMLGTPCTFLGPSRKRGPPKGYIDAIESRLHQTEAVLGVLIAAADGLDADPRAKAVLEDLCEDGMAREIVKRVSRGVYGRGRGAAAGSGKIGSISGDSTPNGGSSVTPPADALEALANTPGTALGRGRMVGLGSDKENGAIAAHPSNEWQDLVTAHIKAKSKIKASRMYSVDQDSSSRPPRLTLAIPQNEVMDGRTDSLESERRMPQRRRLDFEDEAAREDVSLGGGLGLTVTGYVDDDIVESPLFAGSERLEGGVESSPLYSSTQAYNYDNDQRYDDRARRRESPPTNGRSYSQPTNALRDRSQSQSHRISVQEPLISHPLNPAHALRALTSEDPLDADLDVDTPYSGESGLAEAVGQLSLNEDDQIRYHGKASGLHLLVSARPREDGRNEGGIWHFPKARVWPPAHPGNMTGRPHTSRVDDEDYRARAKLPRISLQEELLDLYFTYVHPILPIVHKKSFLEAFNAEKELLAGSKNGTVATNGITAVVSTSFVKSNGNEDSSAASSPSIVSTNTTRLSPLLLLAMFAIAARYAAFGKSDTPIPPEGEMWTAGDDYLEEAKIVLDRTYASSRPSTCQALLLMAYREIGIGAMAQSWLYVGMAVRMAQDLGMHRSSDRWQRVGELLFSATELQERRRIWYTCSIMDKYVSTYIGRPLSIFEHDYDTLLPDIDEDEEMELWEPHSSIPAYKEMAYPPTAFRPVPCRLISRFNASAKLSTILASIVHAIYAVQPVLSRHAEALQLEKTLDKWYHELPPHLRHDPAQKHPVPTPHILTLHMQYWCAVLLLHRPFIRHYISMKFKSPASPIDIEVFNASKKNYNYCVSAANHVTSIVSLFAANFCLARSAVFLTYYMFTAGIMHVTTLAISPDDPQARMGLSKCMEALKKMGVAWPSAERAWELLDGAKDNLAVGQDQGTLLDRGPNRRNKRPMGDGLDDRVAEVNLDRGDGSILANNSDSSGSQQYSPPMQMYNNSTTEIDMSEGAPTDAETSLNYFSTYDRWTPDSSLVFPHGLSTSVLPQQYSTGFVENREASASAASVMRHATTTNGQTTSLDTQGHGRVPQYWNDYTSLGHPSSMLGSIYGMSIMPGSLPHINGGGQAHQNGHGHSTSIDQLHNQSMYMADQYNLFGLSHT